MSLKQFPLLRHLRSWRNPPNLDRNPDDERRANWLELFYDLVYIATVIQLGTYLHHHLTILGALQYGFLFLIVWWSWSGTTYYGNRKVAHALYISGVYTNLPPKIQPQESDSLLSSASP